MIRSTVFAVATALTLQAQAAPTTVRVAFVEALAPRDTTSSERFQKDYDLAISLGRRALEKRLRSCGYALETETSFYDASDPLQARERGAELERKGAWLIVGPRRSNHYMLLAQGAAATPTVSLMASASEVTALGPNHISISPLNAEMARAAALETKARLGKSKNRSYLSVVSKDCASCVDFATVFNAEAKKLGLVETSRLDVAGDAPEVAPIDAAIKAAKPAFVLLPNYSKVSSLVMSQVAPTGSDMFFVGGDGWGDANFGFVHQAPGAAAAKGFSVRGFPPIDQALSRFRLGRELATKQDQLPKGSPALGILKSMDSLTDMLCANRATSREAFARVFAKNGKKLLSAPWGTSIYELKDGGLSYLPKPRGTRAL